MSARISSAVIWNNPSPQVKQGTFHNLVELEHAQQYFELEAHQYVNPHYLAPIEMLLSGPDKGGPHRLTLLPINDAAFEPLSGDDKKWWEEQQHHFPEDSEGLPTKPTFDLLVFETVNFMDGHRSTAKIAELLAAEYLLDIDQAWVDRVVSILAERKLVAK